MKRVALAAMAALALITAGCTDSYGRIDPVRTGLLGAAVGGGAGLVGGALAQDSQKKPWYGGNRRYGNGYGYQGGSYPYRPW